MFLPYWVSDECPLALLTDYKYNDALILKNFDVKIYGKPRPTRLNAEKTIDVTLTESLAMWPTASVNGFYFSHPQSRYFTLGRIDKDQIEEYANAREESIDENETWLAPVLGY